MGLVVGLPNLVSFFELILHSSLTDFPEGWRDFYSHVVAVFPHVSMGRPFQEKYADIKWETDQSKFEAWKDGKTGYPIVDAVRPILQLRHSSHIPNHSRCGSSRLMVSPVLFLLLPLTLA